jgi:hypothetical protein
VHAAAIIRAIIAVVVKAADSSEMPGSTRLHVVTVQKTAIFILAAVYEYLCRKCQVPF